VLLFFSSLHQHKWLNKVNKNGKGRDYRQRKDFCVTSVNTNEETSSGDKNLLKRDLYHPVESTENL
jgi:hypothetical protein